MPGRKLLIAFSLLFAPDVHADHIGLKNGDRLTGSIVKLEGKGLIMKTEFAGTVTLRWDAIESIWSETVLHVASGDETMFVGRVSASGGKVEIETTEHGLVTILKDAIVALRSSEEQAAYERQTNPRLLESWNGSLDAGVNSARGNARSQTVTLAMNATRTTPRNKIGSYFTSIRATSTTTGTRVTTANAARGGVKYNRNFGDRWFIFGSTDLESNELQELDLRLAPGLGVGWRALKNERAQFDINLGGSFNRELFATGTTRDSSELLLGEEFTIKIFNILSLNQKMQLFPNLTETGEFRAAFDSTIAVTLRKWLSWQITLSDRYLSNPLPETRKNDLLLTTGIRLIFAKK